MKLQIIQLDSHDDHISVSDKLKWAKADRVLLVWPRRGLILRRRLDLVLLQRKARSRALQLGLLTHDPVVRDLAHSIDLPVFDSQDVLPEAAWRPSPARQDLAADRQPADLTPPSRRTSRVRSDWLRWLAFGLGLLSVLSVAFVLAPSARLEIRPATTAHSAEASLELDPLEGDGDRLLAVLLTVEIEHAGRAQATGRRSFPGRPASGVVVFTNLGEEPVAIPDGASLRSAQQAEPRFLTTEAATLPGGQGSQVEVPVTAASGGPKGNLPAGAVDAIDGPLGLAATVINPEPITGGTEELASVVAEADRTGLQVRLLEEMQALAAVRLVELAPVDMLLLADSLTRSSIQEQRYDQETGDRAASVGLELAAGYQAWAVERDQLQAAAERAASRFSPSGQLVVPNSLVIESWTFQPVEAGLPALELMLAWQAYRPLDVVRLQSELAGQTIEGAQQQLEAKDSVESASIQLFPAWLERLPWVPARIQLRLAWETG